MSRCESRSPESDQPCILGAPHPGKAHESARIDSLCSVWGDPPPEEEPGECECCGFETTALTLTDCYARTPGHGPFTPDKDKVWAWMCDLCRSTMAGNTYIYPRQYSEDLGYTLRMQAFCTNTILAAIKESS